MFRIARASVRLTPILLRTVSRPISSFPSSSSSVSCLRSFHSSPFPRSDATSSSAPQFLDKNEVIERVLNTVKKFEKVDSSKVTPTAHFNKDLGLDSLDVVEMVMAFEDEFGLNIPDADADKIQSIPDAINYIATQPTAK